MFWTCRDLSGDIEWNSISVRLWVNTILLSCVFDLVCWTLHEKKMSRHVTADSTSVDISSSFCIPFPPLYGGPPEFRSARGFYPLGIFFPAAVALCLLKGDQFVFPLVVQSPSRRLWMWFSIWSWWSDWLFWTFLSNEVVVTVNIWSNQVIWWHSMGGGGRYSTQQQ